MSHSRQQTNAAFTCVTRTASALHYLPANVLDRPRFSPNTSQGLAAVAYCTPLLKSISTTPPYTAERTPSMPPPQEVISKVKEYGPVPPGWVITPQASFTAEGQIKVSHPLDTVSK